MYICKKYKKERIMYKMTVKIAVFAFVLCMSFVGFTQTQVKVEDLVNTKNQDFKVCFTNLDKKFKADFKGRYIKKSDFKKIAKQSQFLVEKKKTAKLFDKKTGKKRDLATTYDKLVEMSKKNRLDINMDYIVTGTPVLIRKNNQYYTYKTMAALITNAKTKYGDSISSTKNELTLLWVVDLKEKNLTKSIQLTSLKAKAVSGFFEYEMQEMQKIAEDLIRKYYQNLLSKEWESVLTPEIPNKKEIESRLKNSTQIDTAGTIRVPLPNSRTFIVGEGNVPTLNMYIAEREQRFALTFNIKINDGLTGGEITKVVYRQLDGFEQPVIVSEPEPQQPQIEEVGMTYKVQILALYSPIPFAELSKEYRNVENVIIEESIIGGKTYFQYVIPVGNNMKEAQALKNKLIGQGIKDVWIVKYKNGKRLYPNKTK